MTEEHKEEEYFSGMRRVITHTLHNKENHHTIKRGVSKSSEHYAYEHILPLLSERNVRSKNYELVALRVAGLIANSGIPNSSEISFGRWVQNNNTSAEDGISTRLTQLVNLDLESAISSFSRVIALVKSNKSVKSGFNWYDLSKDLLNWGDGYSESSLNARQSALRSFYISKDVEKYISDMEEKESTDNE